MVLEDSQIVNNKVKMRMKSEGIDYAHGVP